jgi:hypothetical protein
VLTLLPTVEVALLHSDRRPLRSCQQRGGELSAIKPSSSSSGLPLRLERESFGAAACNCATMGPVSIYAEHVAHANHSTLFISKGSSPATSLGLIRNRGVNVHCFTNQIKRLLRIHTGQQAVIASHNSALRPFASGLVRDQHPVQAAPNLPWSNGPVEGKVHRLKLTKRQMYGAPASISCASGFFSRPNLPVPRRTRKGTTLLHSLPDTVIRGWPARMRSVCAEHF